MLVPCVGVQVTTTVSKLLTLMWIPCRFGRDAFGNLVRGKGRSSASDHHIPR